MEVVAEPVEGEQSRDQVLRHGVAQQVPAGDPESQEQVQILP